VVKNFDEPKGLGEILLDEAPAVFPFHCVSIADGTRNITVGAAVTFLPLLKLGRMAQNLLPNLLPRRKQKLS
jgi:hypothetical protein